MGADIFSENGASSDVISLKKWPSVNLLVKLETFARVAPVDE